MEQIKDANCETGWTYTTIHWSLVNDVFDMIHISCLTELKYESADTFLTLLQTDKTGAFSVLPSSVSK